MANADKFIELTGMVVTVLSALASLINHIIRGKQAEGAPVSPLLLGAGTVLNVGAVNLDKAAQLAKQLRAPKAEAPDAAATPPAE